VPELAVGVLRLGRRVFAPSQLLVMAMVSPGDPAEAMSRVHEVVAEGADVVEVSGGPGGEVEEREEARRVVPFVATVRDAYPELVIGVSTGRREVAREACAAGADLVGGAGFEVAAGYGASVLCPAALAADAVAAGVPVEQIVIEAENIRQLSELVEAGWPVLVSLPDQDAAGSLATAAVGAWLGARVFRVGRVLPTRRVLTMVSAIRGDIPPACAVRGLA
jgi:dihydropteroate synthase